MQSETLPSVQLRLAKLRVPNVPGISPAIQTVFDCSFYLGVEKTIEKGDGEPLIE